MLSETQSYNFKCFLCSGLKLLPSSKWVAGANVKLMPSLPMSEALLKATTHTTMLNRLSEETISPIRHRNSFTIDHQSMRLIQQILALDSISPPLQQPQPFLLRLAVLLLLVSINAKKSTLEGSKKNCNLQRTRLQMFKQYII